MGRVITSAADAPSLPADDEANAAVHSSFITSCGTPLFSRDALTDPLVSEVTVSELGSVPRKEPAELPTYLPTSLVLLWPQPTTADNLLFGLANPITDIKAWRAGQIPTESRLMAVALLPHHGTLGSSIRTGSAQVPKPKTAHANASLLHLWCAAWQGWQSVGGPAGKLNGTLSGAHTHTRAATLAAGCVLAPEFGPCKQSPFHRAPIPCP